MVASNGSPKHTKKLRAMEKIMGENAPSELNVYTLGRALTEDKDISSYSATGAAFLALQTIPEVQELRKQGIINRHEGYLFADLDFETQRVIVSCPDPKKALDIIHQEKNRQIGRFIMSLTLDLIKQVFRQKFGPRNHSKKLRNLMQMCTPEQRKELAKEMADRFYQDLMEM